jgi:hypothetical protein
MAGHMGVKGSLLKVREEKYKGKHGGAQVECVSALQVCLKPIITCRKERTRRMPPNN